MFAVEGGWEGKVHDSEIYSQSHFRRVIQEDEYTIVDKTYIGSYHCVVPFKRTRRLTDQEKSFNIQLTHIRILVEQVIGRINVFGILNQVFRGGLTAHEQIFICCSKLSGLRYKIRCESN